MPKKSLTSQEWTKIYNGLGLGKETTSQLQAFRARHTSALNKNSALKSTVPEIDLSHYKSILKDQSAVQNAEKVLREFKPVDYDLSKWNGVVDAFEGKAVAAAKETLAKISKEEGSLKETLSNIQEARPFEDLTVSHFPHYRCSFLGIHRCGTRGRGRYTVIYYDGALYGATFSLAHPHTLSHWILHKSLDPS
jgi:F-type H+-transporting ATPase subunit d